MKIIIDTREQNPYRFADCETTSGTLASGDYSIAGIEDLVAIERKELSDFLACCGRERDRFKRELKRLQAYRCKAVVIEADLGTILAGDYRSQIAPASVIGSMASWTSRYQVAFILAGNRRGGQEMTLALLRTFWGQCSEFAEVFVEVGGN